jgi:hypothetical protein
LVGLVIGASLVFGTALYLVRTRAKSEIVEPTPVATATGVVSAPEPSPTVAEQPAAVVDLDADQNSPKKITAQAPPGDTLGAEVLLIRQAQQALVSGNAARSLALLDEHAQRFPRGKLANERAVTRVRALCASGRTAQAKAEYARLAQAMPNSPHLGALRAACPGISD